MATRPKTNPRRRDTKAAPKRLKATKQQSRPSLRTQKIPKRRPTMGQAVAEQNLQAQRVSGPLHLPREMMAVVLTCAGIMTSLALASFNPTDASLNASSHTMTKNWIGPAGAYWSDVLFQSLGIGAYVVVLALLAAGWRALMGRRILPQIREWAGLIGLLISSGAGTHILLDGAKMPYPSGGIVGSMVGGVLINEFSVVGGLILSSSLMLVCVAVLIDGVLTSFGVQTGAVLRQGVLWCRHQFISLRERQRHMRQLRDQAQSAKVIAQHAGWGFSEDGKSDILSRPQDHRLADQLAADKGRQWAQKALAKEQKLVQKSALRDRSEPSLALGECVDLPAENEFNVGDSMNSQPSLNIEPVEGKSLTMDVVPGRRPPPPPQEALLEICQAHGDEDKQEEGSAQDHSGVRPVVVPICAAEPSMLRSVGHASKSSGMMLADSDSDSDSDSEMWGSSPLQGELKSGRENADPMIVDVRPEVDVDAIERKAQEGVVVAEEKSFELPSPTLLDIEQSDRQVIDEEQLKNNAKRLTTTLKHYGIEGVVREIRPGPVITMYEFVPSPGTKISKISTLADDLAMSMEAIRVRIVAPIPGKGAVGIEIPNEMVETVFLKELVTQDNFTDSKAKIPIALGKDIEGRGYVTDLAKMPHLLVAGATGAGKSVSINTMIMSILYHATPEDVRMLMVDPKMLELSIYDGIPHLLLPVVTDPKKAAAALRWAVREMELRYQKLSALGVRNIDGYNTKIKSAQDKGETLKIQIKDKMGEAASMECEHLPYIVIIVDELADLMMVASREVESSIMRLAQMARAAGIHLILATQRPSVDVLTGVIKANFPTRIAFQVASKHDSRTILDMVGAEHLLGRGDMLFQSPGVGGVSRVHGCFVSEDEIHRTVDFIKKQGQPDYDESILKMDAEQDEANKVDEVVDEMYDQAVAIVTESRQASISMIQRRLRIGYNRAARLVEHMEKEGVVGPGDGAKPREVLVAPPPML
jgi:DNA segregation ATPase FtsK/SpoIIIE, S-DNA-T family